MMKCMIKDYKKINKKEQRISKSWKREDVIWRRFLREQNRRDELEMDENIGG